MLIRKLNDIRPSEITSESNYLNRRAFIKAGSIAGVWNRQTHATTIH